MQSCEAITIIIHTMATCNQLQSAKGKNNQLIIDFPAGGRNNIKFEELTLTTYRTYPGNPTVQFNPYCILHTYALESCPQENELMWSSSKDRKLARHKQRVEAIQTRNILDSFGDGTVPDESLILCIGIEHLLSDKIIKRTLEQRRRHVRKVLSEQQRQRDLCICDDDSLRVVAEMSSQKSRFRAFKLADGYSKILKDSEGEVWPWTLSTMYAETDDLKNDLAWTIQMNFMTILITVEL